MAETILVLSVILCLGVGNLAGEDEGKSAGLKVGFSQLDITPPVGAIMTGPRLPITRGTDDPLMVRTMVVQNGERTLAIVGIDLVKIRIDLTEEAIADATKRTGIERAGVLVCASHNHSSPFIPMGGPNNEKYIATLPGLIADSIERAHAALQPARMSVGRSLIYGGVQNRRVITKSDGMALNTWLKKLSDLEQTPQVLGTEGPIDPEMWVARFDSLDGNVLGTLVNFTCHPALHNRRGHQDNGKSHWSADFPGVIAEHIAEQYGEQAICVFTQGASGNINPAELFVPDWRERAGVWGKAAVQAAETAIPVDGPVEVAYARRDVEVPLIDPMKQRDGAIARLGWRPESFEAAKRSAADKPKTRKIPVSAARIGTLGIATNAGELFVEWGIDIKKRSPAPHTFVSELTNDWIGYEPTAEAFENEGYETLAGVAFVTLEGIETLVDTAVELLDIIWAEEEEKNQNIPFETFDLDIGETVETRGGATLTLLAVEEPPGKVWNEISRAEVTVSIDGEEHILIAGTYRLPQKRGSVQIDCPVTGGLRDTSHIDHWALEKDARIRVWPGEGPWIDTESFGYPLIQRWFASHTAFSNEPVASRPNGKLYYHAGMDFGGCEALTEVVAATDALVVSAGDDVLTAHQPIADTPVNPRYDVLYLLDDRGWYYRYSHFHSFDPAIKLGTRVKKGQRLGLVGKEGGSGGWTHLHFEIKNRKPSGRWGTEDSYAFLWQGYRDLYDPEILAVARPGHMILAGETVTHDGTRSWSREGEIAKFEWRFSDGTTAAGAMVKKEYSTPGSYRETLIVTDSAGNEDANFVRVKVFSKTDPAAAPPRVHATYHPTLKLRAGEPVTFKCRSFGTTHGEETWDFGDGSPTATTTSDGNVEQLNPEGYATIKHTYSKPGNYFVHVFRKDEKGWLAEDRLYLRVEE